MSVEQVPDHDGLELVVDGRRLTVHSGRPFVVGRGRTVSCVCSPRCRIGSPTAALAGRGVRATCAVRGRGATARSRPDPAWPRPTLSGADLGPSSPLRHPVASSGKLTEFGQPTGEAEGEGLEIFCQPDGRADQDVIVEVVHGCPGDVGLVECLADPAHDPRLPWRRRSSRSSLRSLPRSAGLVQRLPVAAPRWNGTGARIGQRAGPVSVGERTALSSTSSRPAHPR